MVVVVVVVTMIVVMVMVMVMVMVVAAVLVVDVAGFAMRRIEEVRFDLGDPAEVEAADAPLIRVRRGFGGRPVGATCAIPTAAIQVRRR